MRLPRVSIAFLSILTVLIHSESANGQRDALSKSIQSRGDEMWQAARKIWGWAEPGYQETRSSKLLTAILEKAGFRIKRGVAKIPTAFTAEIGKGTPVIGIMGEYDALPGLSQDAVPYRKPRAETKYGHACGHHLFGVASVSACLALAEQIKTGKIDGTLRFYGCPAEEGGSARVFMVRAGLFKDCDIVLHWHPSSGNGASARSNMARIAVKFQFHGKSAHAAGAPERGRSSLDAVELTNHATQLLREHTPDFTRIHHVITAGGGAPNVVPDFAEVFYYVRHPEADVARKVYQRVLKCAQAGALATETKLRVNYLGGTVQMIPNATLAKLALKNLKALNDIRYDADETKFALRIQESFERQVPLFAVRQVAYSSSGVGKGSTDVSDVSWVVPTGGFYTACWVPGTAGHSWQATSAGGMSIGRKGMQLAARVLAANAWDLFHDAKLIAEAKQEFRARRAGRKYRSLLLPGQPPPLDYRDPPRRTLSKTKGTK